MTWVVYVLLALNLALLTWNLQTGTESVATPALAAPAPGEAEQLPLLTELSADALRPRVTVLASAAGSRGSGGSTQAGAGERSAASPASSAAVPTDGAAQDANSDNADQNSRQNGGQSSGTSNTAGTANADEDKLPGSQTERPVTTPGATAGSETTVSAAQACLTVGPLAADAPVQEMSRWLTQAGATVDVRTDERREVALYWVFFPPRTSRELAVAEVKKLRSEGVTDVIAVPKGDMANAVSLGVFSRTDSRDRRVREMNQRGYQPSVAPRYRVKRASWIDVNMVANALTTESIKARWPDVEVSPKPCPVAAAGLNPTIAVGQGASYNTSPAAPRRFFFSGSDAPPPLQDSESSR